MLAIINNGTVDFFDEKKCCGTYHFEDPFKSFFNPLFTPSGKNLVAPAPKNHPHHKGLQFGLCATNGNFWEESKSAEGPEYQYPIGRQRTTALTLLDAAFGTGFQQDIVWETNTTVLFNERRDVSVTKEINAYQWVWRTQLIALQDMDLVKTVWAGSPGYYGLGLRLAEDYFKDGKKFPDNIKNGDARPIIKFQGDDVAVTFEQSATQADTAFIFTFQDNPEDPFAFISLGPTNNIKQPQPLQQGEILERAYTIKVSET